jgi:hypothetical protein
VKPVSPVIPGLEFAEIKIAEDQDEYGTLPALSIDNGERIVTRWTLSWRERLRVIFKGNIYLHVWRFGQPLQPVLLETTTPDLILPEVPNA